MERLVSIDSGETLTATPVRNGGGYSITPRTLERAGQSGDRLRKH